MGYCSKFEILAIKDPENREVYDVTGITDSYEHELDLIINEGCPTEYCKWYSFETDMKLLSERYPDVLFVAKIEGEEKGDLYKEYFRNGLSVSIEAKISFPSLSEHDIAYLGLDTKQ